MPLRWRLPDAFDPGTYLQDNPDVTGGRTAAALHWLRHGRREGRFPRRLEALGVEQALWAGESTAEASLRTLMAGKDRDEALVARLALARVAAAGGDWEEADRLLRGVDARADLIGRLGLPGPLLLQAEIALHRGDAERAARILRLVRRGFGQLPEERLMMASLRADDGPGGPKAWRAALMPLYAPRNLDTPWPGPPAAAAIVPAGKTFDRLTAEAGPHVTDGPLVSVIMAARGAAATIDTALASLAAQSWHRLEVLVVDNGEGGGTTAPGMMTDRIEAWAARDPRIRRIEGRAEPGAYAARNLALSQAKGAMITLQDADDWSHPDRIARQMADLKANPSRPACLSFWARVTNNLQATGLRPDVGLIHPNLSSLMIRREAAEQLGYWDRVRAGADSEYVDRLRRVFGAEALGRVLPGLPLAFGRVEEDSLTRASATGLLGSGAAARAAYLAAARDWHARTPGPALPRHPAERPFPVPPTLQVPSGDTA